MGTQSLHLGARSLWLAMSLTLLIMHLPVYKLSPFLTALRSLFGAAPQKTPEFATDVFIIKPPQRTGESLSSVWSVTQGNILSERKREGTELQRYTRLSDIAQEN
jgi:hypothetical protein